MFSSFSNQKIKQFANANANPTKKKKGLCKTLEFFSDNITHVHDKNDWMMVQTAKQHRALEKFTLPCIFVIYVCTCTSTSLDMDRTLDFDC